jgi:hypothetical protein
VEKIKMLVKLFRAEVYKIIGHRWATGCFIWIWPGLALGFSVVVPLIALLSKTLRDDIATEPTLWTESMISVWFIPNNPVGRLILLGFTAVLFGGEYQWNTWKNVVPRSSRVPLILIKFLAVAVFVVFAFSLMSVIWTIGNGVLVKIAGADYGPVVSADVLETFAGDYSLQVFTTFVSVIISAGYAAAAAMLTRSILGSIIVSFVLSIAETFSFIAFALISWVSGIDSVLGWYRYTPTYNIGNVTTLIADNQRATVELLSEKEVSLSLEASLLVLAIYVFGLMALTAFAFQKQDITN